MPPPPLSKSMQHVITEEGRRRGLNRLDKDLKEYSSAIVKNVREDERLYLVSVAKRLRYCLPPPAPAPDTNAADTPPPVVKAEPNHDEDDAGAGH